MEPVGPVGPEAPMGPVIPVFPLDPPPIVFKSAHPVAPSPIFRIWLSKSYPGSPDCSTGFAAHSEALPLFNKIVAKMVDICVFIRF
jgi:hypothetical protein